MGALGTLTIPFMGSLDGFGSLDSGADLRVSGISAPDGNTVQSQRAQAGVLAMTRKDPDGSAGLMPPGDGEDPAGQFATAQLQEWLDQQLRPAPLSRAAVQAIAILRAVLTYKPRPRLRQRLP